MSDKAGDSIAPWTIKGITPEVRNAAIAAARRENQTIGEWVSRAVRNTIQADRQADRAPVSTEKPQVLPVDRGADLATVERLAAVVAQMAETAQKPPPVSVTRLFYKKVREQLEAKGQAETVPVADNAPVTYPGDANQDQAL